jgi:hypothetical protein
MIFGACAQGITMELLWDFCVVPLLALGFMASGLLLGFLVPLCCNDLPARPLAILTCTFTNTIGLPLPLITSIVAGMPHFTATTNAMTRTLSYLFLANTCLSPFMWTLGPRILACAGGGVAAGTSAATEVGEVTDTAASTGEAYRTVASEGAPVGTDTIGEGERCEAELLDKAPTPTGAAAGEEGEEGEEGEGEDEEEEEGEEEEEEEEEDEEEEEEEEEEEKEEKAVSQAFLSLFT